MAGQGFRPRDLRFILDLLVNWVDVMVLPDLPRWHNTQVMRVLADLVENGYARAKGTGRVKSFKLTRIGLLETIQSLVGESGFWEIRHITLVYYFLRAYRERMMELIAREGSGYSKAVQLEIESLLSPDTFLRDRLKEYEVQIKRLTLRVSEARASEAYAAKLRRQDTPVDQIVLEIARAHPYELEAQKPMSDLLSNIDVDHRLWELTQGTRHRAEDLWQVHLAILTSHRQILKDLLGGRA